MIITLNFKTPDVIDAALEDYDFDPEDETAITPDQVREILSRWVEYGECVTIQIDIDALTAKVLEQ